MNLKTWIPLGVALALGLCAMFVAKNMTSHTSGNDNQGAAKMLVARNDLAAGTSLSMADLQAATVAGTVVPQGVFSNTGDLEGRVLTAAVTKGTPIIEPLLANKGAGGGLQALIPPGMRCITVEINETTGVAGNLVAGCHVDVVTTVNGDNNELMTRTVVENIKIQAVGTKAQADAGTPVKSVTLLAKPKEVEAIELAAATGHPRLALRSYGDVASSHTKGVTLAELRKGQKNDDPFEVQAAELTGATTRPSVEFSTIRIFRAGVESSTTVTEKAKTEPAAAPAASKMVTSVDTDELDEDTNK